MKYLGFISIFFISSCSHDLMPELPFQFKTQYVFIVVMDGARYSETWGDHGHGYIPKLHALAKQGAICTDFRNDGVTSTVPGHTAITTGTYQVINNAGLEMPFNPSVFQYYRSGKSRPQKDAWIFTSKDKLEVLSDCGDPDWKGNYRPSADCGVDGNGSGYREDSVTFRHMLDTVSAYHPHLVLVNFKQPDVAGHANDWQSYTSQISKIDGYIDSLWHFIQTDPLMADKTTMIVTNDHGRHQNGVLDGFVSHGCTCDGCRKIFFLAIGPDIKQGYVESAHHSLVDIPSTAAFLLGFNFLSPQGKPMTSIME